MVSVFVLMASALATGCTTDGTDPGIDAGEDPSGTPQQVDDVTARYERRFMEAMIGHHRMAVEMSAMCVESAVHEELRALCQGMGAAQQREIEDMGAWLQDWYGVSPPEEAPMSGHQMHSMHEMGSLSGAAFEAEFLEEMTTHHTHAVADAGTCVHMALHDPLVELCHDIVDAQLAEIDQMKSWLREWYLTP